MLHDSSLTVEWWGILHRSLFVHCVKFVFGTIPNLAYKGLSVHFESTL